MAPLCRGPSVRCIKLKPEPDLCQGNAAQGVRSTDVQHWMGHKSLEITMRYLARATDVHDALDLVTIPSVGKADPAPRKSAARETHSSRKAAEGANPMLASRAGSR
jgi:hypothetical protein